MNSHFRKSCTVVFVFFKLWINSPPLCVWCVCVSCAFAYFPSRNSMRGLSMVSASASAVLWLGGPLIWYRISAIWRMQPVMRVWKLQGDKLDSDKTTGARLPLRTRSDTEHHVCVCVLADLFAKTVLKLSSTVLSFTCSSFKTSAASVSICSTQVNKPEVLIQSLHSQRHLEKINSLTEAARCSQRSSCL